MVLATKGKAILLLLPKLKIFTTSASMLVSIAAYAWIWGWAFAVGFVLLLLLHEIGHVIQLRREGVEASAPMFIPFLGAVIAARSMGDDAAAEARVGLAGPILGSIASLVPLVIWQATGEEFWQALAYVGFFLNLLNLLPVLPLDGGRAMAALSPWVWAVGFAGLVALTFAFPNPILILVLIFGGIESWRRFKARNTPESRAYHAIPGPDSRARRDHLHRARRAARGRRLRDLPRKGLRRRLARAPLAPRHNLTVRRLFYWCWRNGLAVDTW